MLTPQQIQEMRAKAGIPPQGIPNIKGNAPSAKDRIKALEASTSFVNRFSADINKRGENVVSAIEGTGKYQGESPLRRGVEATAEAFNAVPMTAYNALPENKMIMARSGLSDLGKKIGEKFKKFTDVLGGQIATSADSLANDPLIQRWAMENPELSDKLNNVFDEILGTSSAAGQIAGDILSINQAAKALQKGVDVAPQVGKSISKSLSSLKEKVLGSPHDIVEEAVRKTAQKYGTPTRILNKAESSGSKPIEVMKVYGRDSLPYMDEGGKMVTKDATDFLKGQIKELSQLKQDMLFYQDNPVTFADFKSYMKDLVDAQKGWTAARKASTLQEVNNVLDRMEAGYANSPTAPGGQIPLTELDKIKTEQTALSNSYKSAPGKFEYDTHGLIGRGARDLVDMMAGDEANISEINNWIQSHYDAVKLLDSFNGKTPNGGQLTRALNNLGGEIAGSVVGGSMGHPIIGAFGGRMLADKINSIVNNNFISNPLKRAILRTMEYENPQVVREALNHLDDAIPNISELGNQDLMSTQNQIPNKTTNTTNTIPPNPSTNGQNSQAILKAKQDIQEAIKLRADAPDNVSIEDSFRYGIKDKAYYDNYIKDVQRWINKKSSQINPNYKPNEMLRQQNLKEFNQLRNNELLNVGDKVQTQSELNDLIQKGTPPSNYLKDSLIPKNIPKADSLYGKFEASAGWKPGMKEVFDSALMDGKAEIVKQLISASEVPGDYLIRFWDKIKGVLSENKP